MKLILLICIIFVVIGCSIGGDYTKELSGDYFYRSEGGDVHDILNHSGVGNDIPVNVMSYDYDKNFIVAIQRPNQFDDALYERKFFYKNGRDSSYYWLVCHRQKLILGPLTREEFNSARKKFKVPDHLKVGTKL